MQSGSSSLSNSAGVLAADVVDVVVGSKRLMTRAVMDSTDLRYG